MEQIIFKPGDICKFYGAKYKVTRGNPAGEDTIIVIMENGIELSLSVFPRPGIDVIRKKKQQAPIPKPA